MRYRTTLPALILAWIARVAAAHAQSPSPETTPKPEPSPPAPGDRTNASATADSPPAPVPPAVETDLLTFYKDNYFLTGFTGDTQVKFQFSAKFDLWPNEGHHAVHLGYTQRSIWNLYRESSPFVETNYNPEVFYTFFHSEHRYEPPAGCGFFKERVGVEHESNGEGGNQSRGWNRVYVESRFACYRGDGPFAAATLKVWAPPFGAEDNAAIARHVGYAELGLSVGAERGGGWLSDVDLTAIGRKGTSRALGEGSLELDARWRPPYGRFWRFTPYLYAQMFTGYGETLLRYDDPVTAFRIGLGLSDRSTRAN